MISTSFWGADGKPISVQAFLHNLFGTLPSFFKTEDELRTIWGNPVTRKVLLENLANTGFDKAQLKSLQSLINAEQSDLFDVLEYVFNGERKPMSRVDRVAVAENRIFSPLGPKEREFIDFVLGKYIETGVEELDQDKLPLLLTSKYQSVSEAVNALGGDPGKVRELFVGFQKWLYTKAG
jgi:type I restriction enzyme, R subunit